MGKRPARKTLDQDDDVDSNDDDHQPYQGEAKDIDNEAAIANRKIVKIKRRAPPTGDSAEKPAASGFQLSGALPSMSGNKKPDDKPIGSLFGTSDPKPSGSLFGNSTATGTTNGTGTKITTSQLFGGDNTVDKKGSFGSIFGDKNTQSGSLFGGDSKPSGSLFGANTATTGGGLFGSKPENGNSTGLFGNKTGSLFGNNGTNGSGSSLFGSKPEGSSLFGAKPAGSTLFGGKPGESLFGQQESIFGKGFGEKDKEKDENEDDNGNYITPNEAPSIAIEDKAAVKSPFTKLYEREISKYKICKPEEQKKNCGIGKVSIQKCEFGKEGEAKLTIFKVIFKNNIGKILYEGTILNNSKIRAIVEKAHKNQVKISCCFKDKEKMSIQFCKLNFQRAEDKSAFELEFNKATDFLTKEKK